MSHPVIVSEVKLYIIHLIFPQSFEIGEYGFTKMDDVRTDKPLICDQHSWKCDPYHGRRRWSEHLFEKYVYYLYVTYH